MALGGVIGGLFGAGNKAAEMAFNAQQAQLDRDFQERMSRHKWRYGIEDMKAAGINPALAYSSGMGGAPPGAQARASGGDPAQTALQSYLARSQKNLTRQTAEKVDAETDRTLAEESRVHSAQDLLIEQKKNAVKQGRGIDLQNTALEYSLQRQRADAEFYNSEFGKKLRQVEKTGEAIAPLSDVLNLKSLFMGRGRR